MNLKDSGTLHHLGVNLRHFGVKFEHFGQILRISSAFSCEFRGFWGFSTFWAEFEGFWIISSIFWGETEGFGGISPVFWGEFEGFWGFLQLSAPPPPRFPLPGSFYVISGPAPSTSSIFYPHFLFFHFRSHPSTSGFPPFTSCRVTPRPLGGAVL